MDLPPIPAPLLALLDESRDLARRMVEAQETAADALTLLALDRFADHIDADPRDSTRTAERLAPLCAMTGRALMTLGRRLAIRASADPAGDQAEHPDNDTPAERLRKDDAARERVHQARQKRGPRP